MIKEETKEGSFFRVLKISKEKRNQRGGEGIGKDRNNLERARSSKE